VSPSAEELPKREDRLSGRPGTTATDQRTAGQRDRDRILYSLAFRRLANVTQVVGPLEGHVFHNRLTHSLEVAQIARRLAEEFLRKHPESESAIDVDVVECAGLAHDLGHPPFGHAAEEELNSIGSTCGLADGFEGNAQTFRIVTRLAELNPGCQRGLDLTRASLNAILKYPWVLADKPPKIKKQKFGSYDSDKQTLGFARKLGPPGTERCVEAQIMDLADDIAYSVHDIDDFYRAGLLPIDQLVGDTNTFLEFLSQWKDPHDGPHLAVDDVRRLKNLLELVRLGLPYRGTRAQRVGLRAFTSNQLGHFVSAVSLKRDTATQWRVSIEPTRQLEIDFLKHLVWVFVIANPRLASVQAGHRRIVRDLVSFYSDAIERGKPDVLPPFFQEDAETLGGNKAEAARLAIDIVASLADEQATRLARRVSGYDIGSIHDRVDS